MGWVSGNYQVSQAFYLMGAMFDLEAKAGTPGPGDLLMFLLHGGICTGASEGSG